MKILANGLKTLLNPYTVALFIISILYLLPRILNIKTFPMFTDEAIYVRWAQQGFFNPSDRLLSLSDGKQPLFIWLTSIFMNIFPNPLAAGRMVSLVTGFGTMIGLGVFTYLIFKKNTITFMSMLLYSLFPYAIILEHLALMESTLAMLSIWFINALVFFFQKPNLGRIFLVAHLLGLAMLTKSSGFILMIFIPIFGLFSLLNLHTHKTSHRLTVFLLIVFGISCALIYQSVIYLSNASSFIAIKNMDFSYPITFIFSIKGIQNLLNNIQLMSFWIFQYLTPIISAFLFVPFVYKKIVNKKLIILYLSFLLPFLVIAAIGKIIFPRHIFFIVILLIPLISAIAVSLVEIFTSNIKYKYIVVIIFLVPFIYSDIQINKSLASAPIPEIDKYQYATGWPAGGGLKQIIMYLDAQSKNKDIVIVSEGIYGSLPRIASEIYLSNNPHVTFYSFETPLTSLPSELLESASYKDIYYIFNKTQNHPNISMEIILDLPKEGNKEFIHLYKYIPEIKDTIKT